MSTPDGIPFPSNDTEWALESTKLGIDNLSIHHDVHAKSGSSITWKQFLLLRTLYLKGINAAGLQRDPTPLISGKFRLRSARSLLDSQPGWKDYLQDCPKATKEDARPFPQLNTFSLVRYYQIASSHVPVDSSLDGLVKVDYSPPVTRSRAAAAAAASAEPVTPTRSSGVIGDLSSHFADFGVQDTDTPSSITSAATEHSERTILLSPSSPTPADQALLYRAIRDEQIVNTALLLYLTAVTIHFQNAGGNWSLHRHPFVVKRQGKKIYEARVDGYLQKHGTGEMLAIAEVKPYIRSANLGRIRMQETSQLAAWIHQFPPTKEEFLRRKDSSVRRLLISQDRHEIYLTVAVFDFNYVNYICDAPGVMNQPPSFLKLTEYGPFRTTDAGHMRFLGELILAFSIQESEEESKEEDEDEDEDEEEEDDDDYDEEGEE